MLSNSAGSLILLPVSAGPAACLTLCADRAGQGGSVFTQDDLRVLKKLLRWPAAQLFPGLDLARLVVLQPAGQQALAADAGPIEISPLGAPQFSL